MTDRLALRLCDLAAWVSKGVWRRVAAGESRCLALSRPQTLWEYLSLSPAHRDETRYWRVIAWDGWLPARYI